MDSSISDKNVSHENMIFIVIATAMMIALIFALVAFVGLFRSNFYHLMMEEKTQEMQNKN